MTGNALEGGGRFCKILQLLFGHGLHIRKEKTERRKKAKLKSFHLLMLIEKYCRASLLVSFASVNNSNYLVDKLIHIKGPVPEYEIVQIVLYKYEQDAEQDA